jgi:Zinc-finger double-stranded RNA-binding
LICCAFLVYSMEDGHVLKRARRQIGIVCDACGKQFATSNAFDKHRTSGWLRGTACDVMDDGSTRSRLVATDRPTMSTAMLQKLKGARRSHGTAATCRTFLT